MRNTNCEKCIFADYTDSVEPCAMNIIDQIRESKNLTINNNFYSISNYLCSYAFSMSTYEQHKEELGSINDLKERLYKKSQANYYLVIFIDNDTDISRVSKSILGLPIKPGFVSIITYRNNNTEKLIDTFKTLDNQITWKLHNLLEDFDYQDSLSIVFDTNPARSNHHFFWINDAKSHTSWTQDILKINNIISIKQPIAHALYRNKVSTDGLFMSFKAYEEIKYDMKMGIIEALEKIENPLIQYYA